MKIHPLQMLFSKGKDHKNGVYTQDSMLCALFMDYTRIGVCRKGRRSIYLFLSVRIRQNCKSLKAVTLQGIKEA